MVKIKWKIAQEYCSTVQRVLVLFLRKEVNDIKYETPEKVLVINYNIDFLYQTEVNTVCGTIKVDNSIWKVTAAWKEK